MPREVRGLLLIRDFAESGRTAEVIPPSQIARPAFRYGGRISATGEGFWGKNGISASSAGADSTH